MDQAVTLRAATRDDADFLLMLRNDPAVVEASHVDEPVTRHEHEQWIARTLAASDRQLYLICEHDTPVGQLRLDMTDDGARVSISLQASHRGRGIARDALEQLQRANHDVLLAEVRTANASSLALFASAGFEQTDVDDGFIRLRWPPAGGQPGSLD